MKIYLDMDGVIADFVKAIHKAHGRPYCYDDQSARGNFDIETIWGISVKEFWSTDTYEFWNSVEPTPEADKIVSLVESAVGSENVAILTSPSNGSGCVPGKKDWMRRHFPQFHGRMIFTSADAKRFLAAPDRLLVDDRDKNVLGFIEDGGRAILVPRHWNSMHGFADKSSYYLQEVLTKAQPVTKDSQKF